MVVLLLMHHPTAVSHKGLHGSGVEQTIVGWGGVGGAGCFRGQPLMLLACFRGLGGGCW